MKAKRKSRMQYADRLFRQRIRERDEMRCQARVPINGSYLTYGAFGVACGGPLEVAHFEGRRKMSVRYSDLNAALLCRNHHYWIDTHEADKWEWVASFLGAEKLAELKEASRQNWDRDYDAVLERLRSRVP